ncbi:MAG TPA: class I SAM-dependent methyltransferase [Leptolyngbyaceae cyanobacterium M33_DOE_097]|uniref:Class I SAM-dependent methyltransferase n=1 Tax=Oscillatoriales cyanobacterium SpSt-418 TaxID=2282169 RepID=A0A7C3PUQ6_9CYAN|nr:class I SAM-dependent methyltransferase [Leptolyngbyaceae cyanobacterium M33_DOE_097]
MIQVLQTLQEVDSATQHLRDRGLPTHLTLEKNWDQWLLSQHLSEADRQSPIIDLGCGDCCTLDFLAALGFEQLHGIDLAIQQPVAELPYQLYQGDLTSTFFPDNTFDYGVSISVIEHGVDLDRFFQETYRILKPNGFLFVTTDYWQQKIPVDASIQPFGLAWSIFSSSEVQVMIDLAQQHGFLLESNLEIPTCVEKIVNWYERQYTFIAIGLRKPSA